MDDMAYSILQQLCQLNPISELSWICFDNRFLYNRHSIPFWLSVVLMNSPLQQKGSLWRWWSFALETKCGKQHVFSLGLYTPCSEMYQDKWGNYYYHKTVSECT